MKGGKNIRKKKDILSRIERTINRLTERIKHLTERQEKTDEQIRKTDEQIRKTDEQIEKTFKMIEELKLRQEETDKQIRELKLRQEKTDEQLRETDRKIRQLGEETDRKIRQLGEETDRKIRQISEELRKRIGDLTDAQGLFWESASENGVKKFLEDRGYQIKRISRHVETKTSRGEEGEFDIIFEAQKNGEEEIFIVEVKSTAHAGYINEFIEKLRSIFDFFPEFRGKKIWGVFSSGRYGDGTERYAIKNGLITFGISGEVVILLNPQNQIKPFFN